MQKLIFLIVTLISISSYADSRTYSNKEYGFSLNIPSGVQVVENSKQELSEEELSGLIATFGVSKEQLLDEMNSTFLTIGYYSGPIKDGADSSIIVRHIDWPGVTDKAKIESYSRALIEGEEKDTSELSIKFPEKAILVDLSGKLFARSTAFLNIKNNGKVIFSMPTIYYVTSSRKGVLRFTVSGEVDQITTLINSLAIIRFN